MSDTYGIAVDERAGEEWYGFWMDNDALEALRRKAVWAVQPLTENQEMSYNGQPIGPLRFLYPEKVEFITGLVVCGLATKIEI